MHQKWGGGDNEFKVCLSIQQRDEIYRVFVEIYGLDIA